jgi:hypothetical protein
MRLIELAQRRPFVAAAVLGLLAGTVVGLAVPIRAAAPDEAGKTATWGLSGDTRLARFSGDQFAKVRAARAWGAPDAAAPGAKAATWRLAGIISRPVPMALVLAEGNKTALRVRAGDVLPDGAKVLQVTARGLVFERDGCRQERALYTAADPAGACQPATDTANEPSGK